MAPTNQGKEPPAHNQIQPRYPNPIQFYNTLPHTTTTTTIPLPAHRAVQIHHHATDPAQHGKLNKPHTAHRSTAAPSKRTPNCARPLTPALLGRCGPPQTESNNACALGVDRTGSTKSRAGLSPRSMTPAG